MRLALREEIRSLEAELIRDGAFPSSALMESAGRLAANEILRSAGIERGRARVACGRGNNGGDGFVVARYLREAGWDVRVELVGLRDDLAGDPAIFAKLYRWLGGSIEECPTGELSPPRERELQVDALLGTGLDRPVEGSYALAVDALNAARYTGALVVAVDIPSGLDADRGQPLGMAVRAHTTYTFGLGKPGLFVTPGMDYAGEVRILDIGLPRRSVEKWAVTAGLLEPFEPLLRLPVRPAASHKGTFGHVAVFAGSLGKAGAADLACRGALRAGAGLVTLVAPEGVRATWPEVMHEPVTAFSAEAWDDAFVARKTAMLFGPGVGKSVEARAFLSRLCAHPLPLVLDADGLNLLAEEPGLLAGRRADTVLTPHPAEAGRLLGLDPLAVQADRPTAALTLAKKYESVVVLKGARSIVAMPDGRYWINSSGSPTLATGGTGDVLAGVLVGLLAAGFATERAVCAGVFAHGRAGEVVGHVLGGLRASEVADAIPGELTALCAKAAM